MVVAHGMQHPPSINCCITNSFSQGLKRERREAAGEAKARKKAKAVQQEGGEEGEGEEA